MGLLLDRVLPPTSGKGAPGRGLDPCWGGWLGTQTRLYQALNAMVITVVSMVGKFWVRIYCLVVCGPGGPEVGMPLYTTLHVENLGE